MQIHRSLVDDLAARERADAVQTLLDAPPSTETAQPSDKSENTITWWTQQMVSPNSGLQDRMAFFWHGILTSHRYASGEQELLAPQINLLRSNALGNFRQLLQAFAVDGALIRYLNADSSTARRPNENLARELMELFTLGVGHYGEDDVRAAALAMTGWRVDNDSHEVYFDPERAYADQVTFLGETRNWDVASIVDRLCDHPATARRVSSLLWYHLVGGQLDQAQSSELGTWWQEQSLEIKPLVARILNSEEFLADHYSRPRSGFEYYMALQSVAGFDLSQIWRPRNLGQALYEPPNVAGWPTGDRWLSPDAMLRRSSMAFSFDLEKQVEGALTATVDEILDRCGLFVVGQGTLDALNNAGAGESLGEGSVAQLRWRIAMSSPEFQLT